MRHLNRIDVQGEDHREVVRLRAQLAEIEKRRDQLMGRLAVAQITALQLRALTDTMLDGLNAALDPLWKYKEEP